MACDRRPHAAADRIARVFEAASSARNAIFDANGSAAVSRRGIVVRKCCGWHRR
jgi:hypothetical protein